MFIINPLVIPLSLWYHTYYSLFPNINKKNRRISYSSIFSFFLWQHFNNHGTFFPQHSYAKLAATTLNYKKEVSIKPRFFSILRSTFKNIREFFIVSFFNIFLIFLIFSIRYSPIHQYGNWTRYDSFGNCLNRRFVVDQNVDSNQEKVISEEYKIWKKNTPFLYDSGIPFSTNGVDTTWYLLTHLNGPVWQSSGFQITQCMIILYRSWFGCFHPLEMTLTISWIKSFFLALTPREANRIILWSPMSISLCQRRRSIYETMMRRMVVCSAFALRWL